MSIANTAVKIAYEKGYRVDEEGNVISHTGNKLKVSIVNKKDIPYYSFSVYMGVSNNHKRTAKLRVHKLQAYQKFKEQLFNPGIVVRHLNSNSLDNSYDNITIGTQSENMMDKSKESRLYWAKNASKNLRRFTDAEIKQIREEHKNGFSYRILSERWKCSKSQLSFFLSKTAKKKAQY